MLLPCAAVHAGTGAESICILSSTFSAHKAAEKKWDWGGKVLYCPSEGMKYSQLLSGNIKGATI